MRGMAQIAGAALALWGSVSLAGPVDAGPVDIADLPLQPPARIIILGEIHDNPAHHLTQARLVHKWMPSALVFEMLTPLQAAAIGQTARGNAEQMAQATGWNATGWPDYALYHPIFAASGNAVIYGAALDRAEVRHAMTKGAAEVFGPQAARFGLDAALSDAEQSAREADQMVSHCNALPVEMLPGMVEAQRLRDAAFAKTALKALADTSGPVIVITGTGHADKARGIPAALAQAAPDISVFSMGQMESDPGPGASFDAWIITAPTQRPDPCAAFQKQ